MNFYSTTKDALLDLKEISYNYNKNHSDHIVLDNINLQLYPGEIVGLLGRSGSGKSTLLRIIAGLISPSKGEVHYCGHLIHGPVKGISMVFQTFALFPWLTVLQNVEAGLEALGVESQKRRKRALNAIDLIGLDGFENAYPKELSGGMRQRVGFARALVVNPTLLLMDEPFSALDVLTAETLRTDLLDLWIEGCTPIKSILIVTHNIEEAVFMCDRILLLPTDAKEILYEIKVPFPHLRNRLDPEFLTLVDKVYTAMTSRPSDSLVRKSLEIESYLPHVSTNLMAGLIETLAAEPYLGKADIPKIANLLHLEIDELFPIAEMLQNLRFAEIREGDIFLSTAAKQFANANTQQRKILFAKHLLKHVPLAAYIRQVLDNQGRTQRSRFEQKLAHNLSASSIHETLDAVINWGRYAEIFSYNDQTELFSLEDMER